MLEKMGDLACERDLTFLNRVLIITLHLACLLTRETGEKGSEEYDELHREIYKLVRIHAKGKHVSNRSNTDKKRTQEITDISLISSIL